MNIITGNRYRLDLCYSNLNLSSTKLSLDQRNLKMIIQTYSIVELDSIWIGDLSKLHPKLGVQLKLAQPKLLAELGQYILNTWVGLGFFNLTQFGLDLG